MTAGLSPLFDRALYVTRVRRARRSGPDILAETMAAELESRLALVKRTFAEARAISPFADRLAAAVRTSGRAQHLTSYDIPDTDDLGLAPDSCDALFSILDLHAVNDVPGQLAQMRRALRPDGLFLAALFAGETLTELRQSWLAAETEILAGASPRVAPMIGVRELGALLQRAGFALAVADLDRTMVRYRDALALIHEIGSLGMGNCLVARSRRPVSKRLLGAAVAHYHKHFADPDGRIRATFEVAWATGWSPHQSQQQPMKPGSAKVRLADALKVPEIKLKP
ncbi:MAG: methyltransferase domain-containing protein [Rhizobiales bacterium]|nr:methyltransferase domain-containing protein [Hyphomicrobiales bacterium]MBI3672805.1 methyltransferase domain-containing protein [Hyphomicrobiales bacterium]